MANSITARLAKLRAITALSFPEGFKVMRMDDDKQPEGPYIRLSHLLAKRLLGCGLFGKNLMKYLSKKIICRVRAGLFQLFLDGDFRRLGPSTNFSSLMIAEVFCRGTFPQILQEPWYQDEVAKCQYYRDLAIRRMIFEIVFAYLRPFLKGETGLSLPVFAALQTLVLFCWRDFKSSLDLIVSKNTSGSTSDHEVSDDTRCDGFEKPRNVLDEYYRALELLPTTRQLIESLEKKLIQSNEDK
jgi:hypothetical protein